MVRHFIFIAAALLAAPLYAAESGKIIFVSGTVQVEGEAARVGNTVQDGDLLRTAGDGYLYIRTPDQALLIVRPGTEARFLRDVGLAVNGLAPVGPVGFGGADLDARKSDTLQTSWGDRSATGTTQPPDVAAASQAVTWGRWEKVINQAPTSALVTAGAQRLATNEVYVLFRSEQGTPYMTPERGSAGFALAASEAYVRDAGTGQRTVATLSDGQLTVDFAKATFATSFNVRDQDTSYHMASLGKLSKDGQFSSTNQLAPASTMQVNGALGGNGSATYLFEGPLTPRRTVSGVTVWRTGATR